MNWGCQSRNPRYAVVLGLTILAAGVCMSVPSLAADCTLIKVASLDIDPTLSDAIAVPVTINGAPRKFLVDTGGVVSTVFDDAAAELHLDPLPGGNGAIMYDAAGKKLDRSVTAASFGIGEMHGSNLHFVLVPNHDGSNDVVGTLAPDMLRNFDVDFDFAARKLNLFSPNHCEGQVVYWATAYADIPFSLDSNHITIPVTLDGQDIKAMIDTGSTRTLISAGAAKRLFHIDNNSPGVERIPGTTADSLVQFRYRFKSLVIDGVTVNNPSVELLPDLMEQKMNRDMETEFGIVAHNPIYGPTVDAPRFIVGLDVLRKLHLYIAYREHKLYVTAADASVGH